MFRVSLGLLASLFAGVAVAAPGDPNPPRLNSKDVLAGQRWVEAHVAMDNWLFVGGGDRQFWFVSALPNAATNYPIVRDWVRWEVAEDEPGSRSSLMEVEVDCEKSRARVLEAYSYRQNNLRGPCYVAEIPPEKWEPAARGAIRETFVQAICRGAR